MILQKHSKTLLKHYQLAKERMNILIPPVVRHSFIDTYKTDVDSLWKQIKI